MNFGHFGAAVRPLLLLSLPLAFSMDAQTYSFDPLGSVSTVASSINASGAITGYYLDATGVYHGFVRDPAGNITSFDPSGSTGTFPLSINASGAITGSYSDATGQHGFVRDPAGNITSFDPSGSTGTYPYSINASGAITGSYSDATGQHGFVQDPSGNITSFDPSGSTGTLPLSINASGAITGTYLDATSVYHGFVRDPSGNITSFDPSGSTGTGPASINASGAITGDYGPASHGFVRDPSGNITSFDPMRSVSTVASSINASGAITGSYSDATASHGFAGTVPNGMDISRYTTTPSPYPPAVWQSARSAGVSNVMVQAWGGLSINKRAKSQIADAQENGGMATGAYVLLSYYPTDSTCPIKPGPSSCSPTSQLEAAITAIGGSAVVNTLKVISIDVETIKSEVFSGSTQNVVNTATRISYIRQAVSYIQANFPTVKIAIYTSNGKDMNWTTITGSCGITGTNACPDLIGLPLWDVEHKIFTDESGAQFCGDGVAGLLPWKPWSTNAWSARSGNQYYFGKYSATANAADFDPEAKPANKGCNNPDPFFMLDNVDLDYFDPTLFQ